MKCEKCNVDMRKTYTSIDCCGCCGTDYYRCPLCNEEKQKDY